MSTGSLKSDQLFKGLTRPAMLFGVSYTFCVLNIMISMLTYISTAKFIFMFGMMPAVHLIGYIICFNEPLFVELIMTWLKYCTKCKNKLHHGARSYSTD